MSYDRKVQRTTTTTNRGNGGRYLPPPPPPGRSQRHHSVLGYWVPLITIGTIAVGGLAAWIWSERGHDDDEYPEDKPTRPQTGPGGPYQGPGSQTQSGPNVGAPPGPGAPPGSFPQSDSQPGMPPPVGGEAASYYQTPTSQSRSTTTEVRNDNTFLKRMTGVIGRTPSPQQFFDSASKQVTAGMAAAGAALGSIMEEDKRDDGLRYESQQRFEERREDREGFSDHERWSEEAEEKIRVGAAASSRGEDKAKGRSKRVVAVVLSAETNSDTAHDPDAAYHTEHGSILSHLPGAHNSDTTDLFVLIYAPTLTSLPSLSYEPQVSSRAPSSLGGSYSHIDTPAVTPGSELASISPRIAASGSNDPYFDALYHQALALVSHPSQIMPFTTSDGYIAMLRHLAPQVAYVSDMLSGDQGSRIAGLKGWVGHTVVVVGDDGHGGLADTETETEDERNGGKGRLDRRWYEHSNMVGLGKEVEVVDAARVGDDWSRRVGGKE